MSASLEADSQAVLEALAAAPRDSSTSEELLSRTGLTAERLANAVALLREREHVTTINSATSRLFLLAEITSTGRLALEERPSKLETHVQRERSRRGTLWIVTAALITLFFTALGLLLR